MEKGSEPVADEEISTKKALLPSVKALFLLEGPAGGLAGALMNNAIFVGPCRGLGSRWISNAMFFVGGPCRGLR